MLIAKVDIPNELWEIVNGKKDFYTGKPYGMVQSIFEGIDREGVERFTNCGLEVPEELNCLVLQGKTNMFGSYPKKVTELATGEKFRIKYINFLNIF